MRIQGEAGMGFKLKRKMAVLMIVLVLRRAAHF